MIPLPFIDDEERSERFVEISRRKLAILVLAVLVAGVAACRSGRPGDIGRKPVDRGLASWYGPGFHGRATASGETFDTRQLTAAHKTLPFGTVVQVRNLDNGKAVTVRINDRGPFVRRRVIDLSRAAAEAIDMIGPGVAPVELYLVERGPGVDARADGSARYYTVQLGAFRSASRAELRLERLARDYPQAVVRTTDGWHRLQVGRYEDKAEARAMRRELSRRGHDAVVVPLDPLALDPLD